MSKKPLASHQPLTREELIEVIESSGYPLEVRLFHMLGASGFHPTLGMRFSTADGPSPEVDLVGGDSVREPMLGQKRAELRLALALEAKKFHEPKRFVGFVGQRPSEFEFGMMRLRVSGLPSWNTLREGGAMPPFAGEGKALLSTLAPLLTVPLCVQWGVVLRPSGSRNFPMLEHEQPFWSSMQSLVTTVAAVERDASNFFTEKTDAEFRNMSVWLPAIVIDTPSLHVYNVANGALEDVDWLTLRLMLDINGELSVRTVDVVTERGISNYLDRCKDVLSNFRKYLAVYRRLVEDDATHQRREARQRATSVNRREE